METRKKSYRIIVEIEGNTDTQEIKDNFDSFLGYCPHKTTIKEIIKINI